MPPVAGAGYDSLGKFIEARSPYGTNTTLPAFGAMSVNDALALTDASLPAAVHIPKVYRGHNITLGAFPALDSAADAVAPMRIVVEAGLHKDRHAANPAPALTEQQLLGSLPLEGQKQMMHWNFNGVDHQVTKAIRIWYTYEADDPANPGLKKTVGTFLLVGFVGNGHP